MGQQKRQKYPLELVLRHEGTAELVNAHDETLWSSDTDEDFKDEFSDEFLTEDDVEDLLDYLVDSDIITQTEFEQFKNDNFECIIESMDPEEVEDIENEEDTDDE